MNGLFKEQKTGFLEKRGEQMKDDLVLKSKIARYEEEVEWLQRKLKQSQDKLFCAKAELQQLDAKLSVSERT